MDRHTKYDELSRGENWRRPKVVDIGTPGCDSPYAYSGTDCGYNVDLSTGEMAHLFYDTLGNLAPYDTSGTGPPPGYWGMTNTGPFSNIDLNYYWSGTTYAPGPGSAWNFRFYDGIQFDFPKSNVFYAWAVSPGDALVPVPAVAWLVAGAFVGMGAAAKRRVGTGTA